MPPGLKELTLPPGVNGETKGWLVLTIDEILWLSEPQPVQVSVQWWGQSPGEAQIFTPVDVKSFQRSKIGDILFSRYSIKTGWTKFAEYLRDSSPLKIDVLTSSGEPLAFTVVNDIDKVTDGEGSVEGYYPVVNLSTKETVANLRINLKLETIHEVEANAKPTSGTNMRTNNAKVTLKSRSSSRIQSNNGGQHSEPERDCNHHTPTRSQRVTFADAPLVDGTVTSQSSSATPVASSLVTELLNQSQQLRQDMRRRLESSFNENEIQEGETLPRDKVDQALVAAPVARAGTRTITSTGSTRRDDVSQQTAPKTGIPSWNLPVDRMKELAKVTRLVLALSSVQISQTLLDRISSKDVRKLPTRPRDTTISFFVKYRLPAETEDTSLCSRKVRGNFVDYNERKVYQLIFNSSVLEQWWNYRLDLKVYSRKLNQQVPLLLGEASFGLKHLLLQEKYSSGETLSLPLYASSTVFRDLKLPLDTSEIVGNLHLAFKLESGGLAAGTKLSDSVLNKRPAISGNKKRALSSSPVRRPAVSDGRSDYNSGQAKVPEPERSFGSSAPTSPLKTTQGRRTSYILNSRTLTEGEAASELQQQAEVHLEMRIWKQMDQVWTIKHRSLDGETVEGSIGGGNEFRTSIILLIPGQRGHIHNRLMMSRLNNNYLVVEVWQDGTLLGVVKLNTTPVHTAFKTSCSDPFKSGSEELEFYNQTAEVLDLFQNKVVGELNVELYAIRKTQESVSTLPSSEAAVQTSFIDVSRDKSNFENPPLADTTDECSSPEKENQTIQTIEETPEKLASPSPSKTSELTCDVNDNVCGGLPIELIVEEARNLPTIKSKGGRVEPCCYVTMAGRPEHCSQILPGRAPTWNYRVETRVDEAYILDPRKYLILKVWHHRVPADSSATFGVHSKIADPEADQVVGFVAVDLCPLAAGFPAVTGWYNITDWLGKCRGQLKLSVTPLSTEGLDKQIHSEEDLNESQMTSCEVVQYTTRAAYHGFPDHLSVHPEQIITREPGSVSALSFFSETSNQDNARNDNYWLPPELPRAKDNPNLSTLERSLNKHLSDLSNIAQRFQDPQSQHSTNRTFIIENKENINDAVEPEKSQNNFNTESARTSLQSLSIEELPRDDQPFLTDLGLVLGDLGLFLGDTETTTDRSRPRSGLTSQVFNP